MYKHSYGLFFLTFFLALSTAAARNTRLKRLVNGQDTIHGETGYQAQIIYAKNSFHICGGCLISTQHVLTAAHCVIIYGHLDDPSLMRIVTSSRYVDGYEGEIHRVKYLLPHNEYNNVSRVNDIAVIKIENPFMPFYRQLPINLPTKDVANNSVGVVTGWGKDLNGQLTPTLKRLFVTILDNAQCDRSSGINISSTRKDVICGFTEANVLHGTCKGDSGGPLISGGAVVGIASTVYFRCGGGFPDVYTNVYRYVDFIRRAMAIQ